MHSHLPAKYHADLLEGTLYFLMLDAVLQPLLWKLFKPLLDFQRCPLQEQDLVWFFFLICLPIFLRPLQHLSSFHIGPVLATADMVACRLNAPQCPKRLLKAIAIVTKQTSILRIELMVLACTQGTSWWQLSLKTLLGQPSPPTKHTTTWWRRKSSCKTGGLRDMGPPTNAASLCHSTYTQKIKRY